MSGFLVVLLAIATFTLVCWGIVHLKRLLMSRVGPLSLHRFGMWAFATPPDPIHARTAKAAVIFHATTTAGLAIILPSGEYLGKLHDTFAPVAALFPGVLYLAQHSYDPGYLRTFMGMSLSISAMLAIVFVCIAIATRQRMRRFRSWRSKLTLCSIVVLFVGASGYGALFLELNPSPGNWRSTAIYNLATSGRLGTYVSINAVWSLGQLMFFYALILSLLAPIDRTTRTTDPLADDPPRLKAESH